MFTLLLIYSHFFLINIVITARMIPPTFILTCLADYRLLTRSLISKEWEPYILEMVRMETSYWITAMNAE